MEGGETGRALPFAFALAHSGADFEPETETAPVPNPETVLFTAMKNEGPFLLEWVAHHKAAGFDTVTVVSNDCTDGSDLLLDALDAAGYLHHLRQTVPPDMAPQLSAAREFESGFELEGKWVLWLDADEFLNIHTGDGSVQTLLARLGPASGIAINWRVFGTSGQAVWDGQPIAQRQTGCAEPSYKPHQAVKTLFRYGWQFTHMDVHAPHAAAGAEEAFHILDSGGSAVAQRAFFYDRDGAPRYRARIRHVHDIYRLAQVNHYALRSRESFALKSLRGDGTMTAAENALRGRNEAMKFRHGKKFWRKYDIDTCTDTSILRYAGGTNRILGDMLANPDIRQAYDDCCGIFRQNRAALERDLGIDFETAKRWEFLLALEQTFQGFSSAAKMLTDNNE